MSFAAVAGCVGIAAAVAVGRWPEGRRMALLILCWQAVAFGDRIDDAWPHSRIAVTLSMLASGLQAPAYAQMVLAYPTGRLRGRLDRSFVAVTYATGLLWVLIPSLFADFRCPGCSPAVPSLLFTGTVVDLTIPGKLFDCWFIVLGVAFLVLVARRARRAPPGALRTLLPLAAASVFAAADLIAARVAVLGGWNQAYASLQWLDTLNLLVLPLAIFAGIAAIRRDRGPLGDLVVELGATPPGEIRAALARAVGDPALELALWLPERGQFVDENGAAVAVEAGAGRAVTRIGPGGRPLAAIVHDAQLLGQRELLEAAGSAARLALENARLQAELRAQLAELRASRARIVAAADAERRRVERDLHDGAQQRLLALGLALQLLRDSGSDARLLDEAQEELRAALRELRELARGLHPSILTDSGLPAAVASLADRATIPISTRVVAERQPRDVESAAYFIVSEALANVTKHARARAASVSIARENGRLIVEVADDGCGGADVAGSGLQGLADRVGALDGTLRVETAPGAGTAIRAEIPCASS